MYSLLLFNLLTKIIKKLNIPNSNINTVAQINFIYLKK